MGSISETRILEILVSDPVAKLKPVAEYMEKPFPVLSENASIEEIANSMDHQRSAILVKHPTGYDILTKQTSPSVSWLRMAREDLVKLYTASNQPDKAEKFRAELRP